MKFLLPLPILFGVASASEIKGMLRKEDIPSSGRDWVTLENGVEFQPGDEDPRLDYVRKLWGSGKEDDLAFVDGTETYYDEYAQAWRFLGFYTDCDACGGEENYNPAYCVQQGKQQACQRFLLWAAYVDLGYEGNGVGEYKYYDRTNKKWIDDACEESDSSRCVKMDCHEPDSHFKLLGIFKDPDYSTWMETLLKNQADCVWTDDEYKFMQYDRDAWPQQCTAVDDGLYYDTKPGRRGTMDIGLYSDGQCSTDYDGDTTAEYVVNSMADNDNGNNNNGNDVSLDDELEAWNDAFDAFKICQPCKVSSVVSIVNADAGSNVNGDRYQHRDEDNQNNGDGDDNGDDDDFNCLENNNAVNQCMKFRANTNMFTASYRDVMLAERQDTVTGIAIGAIAFGSPVVKKENGWKHDLFSVLFLLACVLFFAFAVTKYHKIKKESRSSKEQPLVEKNNRNRSRSRSQRRNSRNASS